MNIFELVSFAVPILVGAYVGYLVASGVGAILGAALVTGGLVTIIAVVERSRGK